MDVSVRLCFQYRMNSKIQNLVNDLIYGGQLKTGSLAVALQRSVMEDCSREIEDCWFFPVLNPDNCICVVDTSYSKDSEESKDESKSSFVNRFESQITLHLLQAFIQIGNSDIGVISPYKGQVELIRTLLPEAVLKNTSVEVNTVDQFQGRDKDIILVSMARTAKIGDLLKDWRRVNVLLTRARKKIVLVMNCKAMQESPIVPLIAEHALYLKVPC
jgi:DNA replication ATP-dependent helicase Dna2